MAFANTLSDYPNPMAQSFTVTSPSGSTLTGVTLYFASKPASGYPVTLELRPIINGAPSANQYIPGTRVTIKSGDVTTSATYTARSNGTFFEFSEPVYVPENSELAFVVYSNADAGAYKLWHAKQGEFKYINGNPSTTARVNSQPASGVLYKSSNGTAWTPEPSLDLAFIIHKAKFTAQNSTVKLFADFPPYRNLSQNGLAPDPLIYTAGSNQIKVLDPGHGYSNGDTVTFLDDTNIATADRPVRSGNVDNGIDGDYILGKRTVSNVDAWGYTITTGDSAAASNATTSKRGGGSGLLVSQQFRFTELELKMPYVMGENSNLRAEYVATNARDIMDQTSLTSVSDITGSINYGTNGNGIILKVNERIGVIKPLVIADSAQVTDNGRHASYIQLGFTADYDNAAPIVNLNDAVLMVGGSFIDYPDSDGASLITGRHYTNTIPYVPESDPSNGSAAAKHITIPYNLISKSPATSIRVLVDAMRPPFSDFEMWYRTTNREDTRIEEVSWTKFSTSAEGPNISNYDDMPRSFDENEYEFTVFDLPSFDTYQIKTVLYSSNSSNVPVISNLRTIATV